MGILSSVLTVLTCLYSATFYYGDAFITQPQAIILTILNMKEMIKLLHVTVCGGAVFISKCPAQICPGPDTGHCWDTGPVSPP